jgi:hypothetical protein
MKTLDSTISQMIKSDDDNDRNDNDDHNRDNDDKYIEIMIMIC